MKAELMCKSLHHDPTIHDPKTHDSCINYAFLCMPWADWRKRKQLTKHGKLYWIIRIGLNSICKKLIKFYVISFQPAHLVSPPEPSCLFRELIYAIHSQILSALLWHVGKIHIRRQALFTYFRARCFRSSRDCSKKSEMC